MLGGCIRGLPREATRRRTTRRPCLLDEFIAEAMQILQTERDVKEVGVQRVHPLPFAAAADQDHYEAYFQQSTSGCTSKGGRGADGAANRAASGAISCR